MFTVVLLIPAGRNFKDKKMYDQWPYQRNALLDIALRWTFSFDHLNNKIHLNWNSTNIQFDETTVYNATVYSKYSVICRF